uniref:Uncharacterized protein n=1 Tax=viral metagenome TaxID=1070528 RepID=A0A6C0BXB2_9ZZZZ
MINKNIIDENVNIQLVEDFNKSNDEFNLIKLMEDFENISLHENDNENHNYESDQLYTDMLNYDMNFTVKQLLLICEFYGLLKDVKTSKMKKQDIIEQILMFENNNDNYELVIRRKELWYYINELKEDKMMKKFIIWN